jgi:hypothetical protein
MSPLHKGQLVNYALVVLAVACLLVVILTRGKVTTEEGESRESNLLVAWRPEEVTRIEIEQRGERVVLTRQITADAASADEWRIESSLPTQADSYAVDKLLGALEFATWVRRVPENGLDRAAFGLNNPRSVLRAQMGAISYRIALGNQAPSPPGAAYVELTGDGAPRPGVMVIKGDLVGELGAGPEHFRRRDLSRYVVGELSRLVLEGAGGKRALVQMPPGIWRLEGGFLVDRELIRRAFAELSRSEGESFDARQAEPALRGADTVRATLVPSDAKQPTAELEVGGQCPSNPKQVVGFRKKPDPLAVCLPPSALDLLKVPAEQLVQRTPFSLRTDEVESLVIEEGGRRLELLRTGTAFTLRAPEKAEVELAVGNERLELMLGTSAELVENPELKRLGLDPPSGTATVTSAAESDAKVITESVTYSGTLPDGSRTLRRKLDGAVLRLERDAGRAFTPDATLVRRPQIFDFSQSDVERVDLEWDDIKERVSRSEGVLRLEEPEGFGYDAGLIDEVVQALGSLTADRWVSDADDGSFGLAHAELTVKVRLKDTDAGPRERVLVVGASTSGGAFASIQGEQGVFLMPRRALDTLETLLLDRGVFTVDPSAMQRIELDARGRSAVLIRRGDQFIEAGGRAELGSSRIQQIIEVLSALRAQAAVHLGPPAKSEGFTAPLLSVRIQRTGGAASLGTLRFEIGVGDSWRGMSIYYGRVDGVHATYVLARSQVQSVIDAL